MEQLKRAGASILGKTTLGELGGGDTHGSLFGSTRNPYALERTVGGSSGGTAACVAANFATVGVGQEGLASIRRPAAWTCIVGMRPTAGLVSRGGVYAGWPSVHGSLGPMARTVTDMATLLDVMVGYDPEDPLTARGVGQIPARYTTYLDAHGLQGARLGILREPMGLQTEPDSDDFRQVTEVFDRAVAALRAAGADIVDPIVIPQLRELLATRAGSFADEEEAFQRYFGRSAHPPFPSRAAAAASPDFAHVVRRSQERWTRAPDPSAHYAYLKARDALMTALLKISYHPQSGWFEDTPLKGGTEEGCPLKGVQQDTCLLRLGSVRGTTIALLSSHRGIVCLLSVARRIGLGAVVGCGKRDSPTRRPLLPLNAGTAEPVRVSPPEAVAYHLELWRIIGWTLSCTRPSSTSRRVSPMGSTHRSSIKKVLHI